jgi:hypothetical protein
VAVTLVVRGTSGVDAAVGDDRLERRPVPQVERVDRLDVVVGVHHDRRRTLGVQPVGVHDRMAARVRRLDVLEADPPEALDEEVGRGARVRVVLAKRADARDPQEI